MAPFGSHAPYFLVLLRGAPLAERDGRDGTLTSFSIERPYKKDPITRPSRPGFATAPRTTAILSNDPANRVALDWWPGLAW